MKVRSIEREPFRFYVESESSVGTEYLCDLTELPRKGRREGEFNGRCSCHQFEIRLRPIVENEPETVLRCKHLKAARQRFADAAIAILTREKVRANSPGKPYNLKPYPGRNQ